MDGTIFRMKVKPGQQQNVIDHLAAWDKGRGSAVKGNKGGLLLKPDNKPGELVAAAVFEDKATYEANADDPAQDAWYRELREMLEADPEWEDGEYVSAEIL